MLGVLAANHTPILLCLMVLVAAAYDITMIKSDYADVWAFSLSIVWGIYAAFVVILEMHFGCACGYLGVLALAFIVNIEKEGEDARNVRVFILPIYTVLSLIQFGLLFLHHKAGLRRENVSDSDLSEK
jgi:hypothetical protein